MPSSQRRKTSVQAFGGYPKGVHQSVIGKCTIDVALIEAPNGSACACFDAPTAANDFRPQSYRLPTDRFRRVAIDLTTCLAGLSSPLIGDRQSQTRSSARRGWAGSGLSRRMSTNAFGPPRGRCCVMTTGRSNWQPGARPHHHPRPPRSGEGVLPLLVDDQARIRTAPEVLVLECRASAATRVINIRSLFATPPEMPISMTARVL